MRRRHGKAMKTYAALWIISFLANCAVAGPVISGADISALPWIESLGGVFRDHRKADDEIAILRRHGCWLFRVRLFVDPSQDFAKTWGATQDLASVRKLGRRIKAAGGEFLLDLHYSDTWADPTHQTKPKAWQSLDVDGLTSRVGEYTTDVLRDLDAAGARPDWVQVGNEITSGMLWPEGKLYGGPKADEPQKWRNFVRFVDSGVKAVRAFERGGAKIRVILHIHGGGRAGLPQSFFKRFAEAGGGAVDYDTIGLSFYPTWKDSLADLKNNLADLVTAQGKDILLAEVAYPWAAVEGIEGRESMQWPMTPAGQADYLRETVHALQDVPDGHGIGFVWWYSDSIPVKGQRIWRGGNEALFDHAGDALSTLDLFKAKD